MLKECWVFGTGQRCAPFLAAPRPVKARSTGVERTPDSGTRAYLLRRIDTIRDGVAMKSGVLADLRPSAGC
jgi:hypothetical protein